MIRLLLFKYYAGGPGTQPVAGLFVRAFGGQAGPGATARVTVDLRRKVGAACIVFQDGSIFRSGKAAVCSSGGDST
eukprot:COSAG01_NODE_39146_length_480_cov_1.307087_2_plen_76_part_00